MKEEDWDEVVNSKKHVLLFWYTPWCIRCLQIIKPHLVQAADDILELRNNVLFAVVDGHDEKGMKERYEIDREIPHCGQFLMRMALALSFF